MFLDLMNKSTKGESRVQGHPILYSTYRRYDFVIIIESVARSYKVRNCSFHVVPLYNRKERTVAQEVKMVIRRI